MVGARSTVHIHVESPLLLHHLQGLCSQPRQLSEVVDSENVVGKWELDSS
jgi:hypothetical protein